MKDHKAGVVDFEAIDPQEVKVRVYGDAAVVSGRYHVKLTIGGQQDRRPGPRHRGLRQARREVAVRLDASDKHCR